MPDSRGSRTYDWVLIGAVMLLASMFAALLGSWLLFGSDEEVDRQESAAVIDGFRGYPIYSAGAEFDGVPLDRVYTPDDPTEEWRPTFITYGTCGEALWSGCEPPLFLRTRRGCLREIEPVDRIRARTFKWEADSLAIQAGDVVVEIFAPPERREAVARALTTYSPAEGSAGLEVSTAGDLPGSTCELFRFNASPSSTPFPLPTDDDRDYGPQERLAATVISAFGPIQRVYEISDAEAVLGTRLLRSTNDPRFMLWRGVGELVTIFRYFGGEPSVAFDYWAPGKECLMELRYDLESEGGFGYHEDGTPATLAGRAGHFWESDGAVAFVFFPGEVSGTTRLRLAAYSRCDFTREELEQFVASLTY